MNEERHYPKSLDDFKAKVTGFIIKSINKYGSCNCFRFTEYLNINCKYCDTIIISAQLNQNGDINNDMEYNMHYYNQYNQLYGGRIHAPFIMVNCPFSNGKTNNSIISTCASHELTHLYDDWQALSNGKESIVRQSMIMDSNNLLSTLINSNIEFEKGIGFLLYLSIKEEQKAFLSQTVQELKNLRCNYSNYKEKIMDTSLYKNIKKSYDMFRNGIDAVSDSTLYSFNNLIFTNYPKANIPKYNKKEFNHNIYRDKLSKWADRIYNKIIKDYGSLISYYLEPTNEEIKKRNCILII